MGLCPKGSNNDDSKLLFNYESSFEKVAGGGNAVDGNGINPSISGEAHYNNYSTGASIEFVTAGATTNEQTLQLSEDKALSGTAEITAIDGIAEIGSTDGRPKVAVIACLLKATVKGEFEFGDNNVEVELKGALLSGGVKLDLTTGIDFQIGLGAVGFGVSLSFSNDELGTLASKDLN